MHNHPSNVHSPGQAPGEARALPPRLSPLEAFESLLLDLFTFDEFTRFLQSHFGNTLWYDLPCHIGVPHTAYVHEAVALIKRHGQIDRRFFLHLCKLRPGRELASDPVAQGLLCLMGSSDKIINRFEVKEGRATGYDRDDKEIVTVPVTEEIFVRDAFDEKLEVVRNNTPLPRTEPKDRP